MLDFTNESAIWLEHSGNSSFLLQVPSAGAAWRLGVTQWLGWNNLELHYLAVGAGCQLGPQGIFSQSFGTWAFRVVFTFFPACCLSSNSKCLQRVSLGHIHFYESAWKVRKHHFCCSYRLHGRLRFLSIITWGECVGRDMSSWSVFFLIQFATNVKE